MKSPFNINFRFLSKLMQPFKNLILDYKIFSRNNYKKIISLKKIKI